jgi:hypothetical protein
MARASHLVGRFFGSIFAGSVSAADVEWLSGVLTAEELRLWQRMGRIDQVESVGVARRAAAALPAEPAPDPAWLAAALLHDIGKKDAGFGTYRRAVATILGKVMGPGVTHAWMQSSGSLRRVGLYLHHDEIGETAVLVAGGRPEVAAWVRAHHDPTRWGSTGLPMEVCRVLAAADGERV